MASFNEQQKVSDYLDHFLKNTLKRNGVRTASLSTFATNYPENRTVVVRNFNKTEHTLTLFTHALSNKVEQITKNSNCCLLWYEPKNKIQIQFFASAVIIEEEQRLKQEFQKVSEFSKKDYLGLKPGSSFEQDTKNQYSEELHFCAIELHIDHYICLELGREKHFKFRLNTEGKIERLIP